MVAHAEYIWLDGAKPTKSLRSKTRILSRDKKAKVTIADFPEWTFDGSSSYQAPGDKSDLVLRPVNFVPDPLRGKNSYLVMCEVFHRDGEPVISNTRALLRDQLALADKNLEPWIGFEQEYTFFANNRPLGWPVAGYPEPQGPYYCGVGAERSFGRPIVEEHMRLCLKAGLLFFGINAEVMPAQWEFQIGHRGFSGEKADPLTVSDHLWLARWLILRVAEQYGVVVSFDNKPVKGDWNGSGAHTNFSTRDMRDKKLGWETIERFIEALKTRHQHHILGYGHGLEERLTGRHETCDINTFRSGLSDRGASVRIPHGVAKDQCGYIEDRRPGANCDPYVVSALLIETMTLSKNHSLVVKKKKTSDSGRPLALLPK
jgi:glutamine synthetase